MCAHICVFVQSSSYTNIDTRDSHYPMRPINQSPTTFLFSIPFLFLLKGPLYSCYTTSTSSPQDNSSTDRYPQSPDKCMHSFHSRRDRGFVSLSKCIECEHSLPRSECERVKVKVCDQGKKCQRLCAENTFIDG